jgi:hypothetical protein
LVKIKFTKSSLSVQEKISDIIKESKHILVEKGYVTEEQNIIFTDNMISIPIFDISKIPFLLRYSFKTKNKVIILCHDTLLEASLDLYCWTCLLPGLKHSTYQQYEKEAMVLWKWLTK